MANYCTNEITIAAPAVIFNGVIAPTHFIRIPTKIGEDYFNEECFRWENPFNIGASMARHGRTVGLWNPVYGRRGVDSIVAHARALSKKGGQNNKSLLIDLVIDSRWVPPQVELEELAIRFNQLGWKMLSHELGNDILEAHTFYPEDEAVESLSLDPEQFMLDEEEYEMDWDAIFVASGGDEWVDAVREMNEEYPFTQSVRMYSEYRYGDMEWKEWKQWVESATLDDLCEADPMKIDLLSVVVGHGDIETLELLASRGVSPISVIGESRVEDEYRPSTLSIAAGLVGNKLDPNASVASWMIKNTISARITGQELADLSWIAGLYPSLAPIVQEVIQRKWISEDSIELVSKSFDDMNEYGIRIGNENWRRNLLGSLVDAGYDIRPFMRDGCFLKGLANEVWSLSVSRVEPTAKRARKKM